MVTDALFVYVTCPDDDVAQSIGRACVDAQHAACANILPGMKSIYRWQESVETASEVVLILKTTENAWPLLYDMVQAAHPYDTPCIVALPIIDGHPRYLKWLGSATE